MDGIRERNTALCNYMIDQLVKSESLIPMRDLVLFCHVTNGLGYNWEQSSDSQENKNFKYFRSLNPDVDNHILTAMANGCFKPQNFVHPLDDYYTLPGYLDRRVLPLLFDAADHIADRQQAGHANLDGLEFLSFIYMFFLLVHPFVDGNGRVARNILDYYNKVLHLGLEDVWNGGCGKFSSKSFHKEAFQKFYYDARLHRIRYDELYFPSLRMRLEHEKMAECLSKWALQARDTINVAQPACVKIMARGIRQLKVNGAGN